MIEKPFFPKMQFSSYCAPHERFFALWPRKMFNGRWIWLRFGYRQLMVVHEYLHSPYDDPFFVYSDQTQ